MKLPLEKTGIWLRLSTTFFSTVGLLFISWLYAVIVFAFAYSTMLKKSLPVKYRKVKDVSILLAIIYQVGAIALIPCLFKNRRWFFASAGIASLSCFGTLLLPITLNAYWHWAFLYCVNIFLLIAIYGYKDQRKFNIVYLCPLVLVIIYFAGLLIYNNQLDNDILQRRAEISRKLGRSIEIEDFWETQKKGLQPDQEPLKSLIAIRDMDSIQLPRDTPYLSHNELKNSLEQWQSKHQKEIKVIDAFLQIPVQKVGHACNSEALASIQLDELSAFRKTAMYLCSDLAVNCKDRDIVIKRNRELEKIRDWALKSDFIIGKIVALVIERMRLQALAYPLQSGSLKPDDWRNVLKNKIDWGAMMADAMGDEATSFQSIFDLLPNPDSMLLERVYFGLGQAVKYSPLEFSIHFKRDYRFALDGYLKQIGLFLEKNDLPANKRIEYVKYTKTAELIPHRNFYILSTMLLPAMESLHVKQAQIEDYYRLVDTAVKLNSYRKIHGKLPENLDFLGKPLLDSLNQLPVVYEHGTINIQDLNRQKIIERYGFRLYTCDESGKDPGALKAHNAFTVILNGE